jgi:mono/diheme cytochrome c family protein
MKTNRGSTRDARARCAVVLTACILTSAVVLLAQSGAASAPSFRNGKEVYDRGCITCHGPSGRGTPKSTLGFEPPKTFPDFTVCNATAREANRDWKAIITNGGPARGFSDIMPSFAEMLTSEQIDMVIEHLRALCREDWPRGELNLPRALVSEKAFPEDEAVISGTVNAGTPGAADFTLVYERRFGARNQIELSLPVSADQQDAGNWVAGVGDVALGYKRVLLSNLRSGSILAAQGEMVLPTGDASKGLGTGVLFFEGFASYGQLLPKQSFFQFQAGFELPTQPEEANRAVFWRTLVGKSLAQDSGFGRMWTPMVELLADRELETGQRTNWDLVPQFQVTLSARQHVRANVGVKIPVNDRAARPKQILFYLLWDWFDGGLREGWRGPRNGSR